MITGGYDKLVEIARDNVCSVHKTSLEVAWDKKQWVLACGGDGGHYPDSVSRNPSLTQLYKQGEELPGYIEDKIKQRQRREAMPKNTEAQGVKLWLVPTKDLASGQLMTPEQVQGVIAYAGKYHLDPERGHVVLMYGKPYFTIDAYLYHARQTGTEYSLESRPMTGPELDLYKLGATDVGWLAVITFVKTGEKFTGTGIVTYQEITEPSKHDPNVPAAPVVAKHPQLLCQKRAEWQALRRVFPIGGE